VSIDDVVSAEESGFRIFTTFHDVAPETIREFVAESPKVDDVDLLSKDDQVHTAECKVTDRRTAEELAGELDVSHSTVSRHLREAERRVFSLIFEEE